MKSSKSHEKNKRVMTHKERLKLIYTPIVIRTYGTSYKHAGAGKNPSNLSDKTLETLVGISL